MTTPPAPPVSDAPPASVGSIDLSNWKLTLPTGSEGKPTEIQPAQLVDGYTNAPYFSVAADGALVFFSPVDGVTTKNSSYPRTELRELLNPSDDNDNWNPGSGTHTLSAAVKIDQIPSTGKVIIGQIHGFGDGARPMVKLQYNGGDLFAQIKLDPNSSDEIKIPLGSVPLGEKFDYKIEAGGGKVTVTVNGVSTTADISKWSGKSAYFKAGAYGQDNDGPSTEGAVVRFYALNITHEK